MGDRFRSGTRFIWVFVKLLVSSVRKKGEVVVEVVRWVGSCRFEFSRKCRLGVGMGVGFSKGL